MQLTDAELALLNEERLSNYLIPAPLIREMFELLLRDAERYGER
jgi:hypothetical protein